ncbi:hypothetical protein Forpi1262_v016698 [Fusarium oxysporum f. sp. raphani]|uniref:Uncharacterized protein n=1 Tax=Fusarium oxysporum f. sp. raphani TaxID=96318 RepID=A0A8J5UDR3_FUSOX|nr:hypothetical protein Forpi1262_v016698 [Fusarium oxysporum f. sp. raphani]
MGLGKRGRKAGVVSEDDLPGYISEEDSSTHSSDLNSESDKENVDQSPREVPVYQSDPEVEGIRMISSTPLLINWNEANTPELKMRQIRQYEQYVALRIECSVASGTPLTPSVSHVNEKLPKAHTTIAINGITAAHEMRRLKEKNLKRSVRDQGTVILANYGPITVYDARLRVAKDLHNRRANQAAEELRFHKKEVRDEAAYARRWLLQVRKLLRASLRDLRVADIVRSQPTYSQEVKSFTTGQFHLKAQHQECISSTALLGTRYCLHREMHSKMRKSKELASLAMKSGQSEVPKVFKFRWNPPFLLPFDYDFNNCKEAVDFIIADEEKRRALRQKLCLEIDGVEIDEDNEESDSEEAESFEDEEIAIMDSIIVR